MSKPQRIVFDEEYLLAIYRPTGRFDAKMADRLLRFLFLVESAETRPFNRLLDLSRVREIQLNEAEVSRIAEWRRSAVEKREPFRTAILAPTPLGFGVGHMYERLMKGSNIKVRVVQTAVMAARWLAVPLAVIDTQAVGKSAVV